MSQANQTTHQWHYAINGQQHGPVPWTELRKLATKGKLARSDRVWRQGYAEWVLAQQVQDLFATDARQSSSVGVMKRLFVRFKKAKADSATFQNFAGSASHQVKSKTTWLWKIFVALWMFFWVFIIIAVGIVFGIGIADVIGLLRVAIEWLHASYPDFTYQTTVDFARNWIANSHDKNWLLVDSVAVAVLITFFGFLFVCFRRRSRVASYIGFALFSFATAATLYQLHVMHRGENQNEGTPTIAAVAKGSTTSNSRKTGLASVQTHPNFTDTEIYKRGFKDGSEGLYPHPNPTPANLDVVDTAAYQAGYKDGFDAAPPPSTANLTKRQFIDKMKQIMAYGSYINDSGAHAIFLQHTFQRTFGDPDSNVEWVNSQRLYRYQCLDGEIQLTVMFGPASMVVVNGIDLF